MKRNLKKVVAIGMAGTLLASIFTGCGNSGSTDQKNSGEKEGEVRYDVDNMEFDNVEIRVAFRHNEAAESGKVYYQKLEEFNKENEGQIKVVDESISTESDYLNKLSTDFASGDAPNAFMEYGGSRTKAYLDAGYLLDFTPYFEEYPEWEESVHDFCWGTCKYEGYDGTYGVPWGNYQLVMYYNKTMLDEAGVEVPESWDDLIKVCEVLTEKGYQPFNYSDKDDYHFEHLLSVLALKAYGPEIVEQLATREETYDGEKMTKIYSLMKDMIDKGYWGDAPLSTDLATERSMFEEGQTAFFIDGSWNPGHFRNDGSELFENEEIGVARIPYINEEYATVEMGGGSDTYYISTLNKSEEEIAATVKFVKYITSQETANDVALSTPTTYAIKTTVDTGNYLLDDVIELMEGTTESELELPSSDPVTAAMNTVRTSLQALCTGASAEEVGKNIVDGISQYEE